jgi:ribosomal-protein-alanine N-acetyltransferase
VLGYGFETLSLHRIFARHFTRNPASWRVMHKIGMALGVTPDNTDG